MFGHWLERAAAVWGLVYRARDSFEEDDDGDIAGLELVGKE